MRTISARSPAGYSWSDIQALHYPDRVVQHSLCDNVVAQVLETHLICDNAACRMGKGTSFAMDRLIKEKLRIKYYTRYMDDMVLVHPSKAYLKACLHEMEVLAHALKLTFNDKTHISPLKNGVEYVGWRFNLTDTGRVVKRLRTSTKRRMKRNIALLKNGYRQGAKDTEQLSQHKAAICGYLKQGDTGHLRKRLCMQIEEITTAK